MILTILCKVVDNFGDIGVAWRMARQLRIKNAELKINLIVDDLTAFSKIDNQINPALDFQSFHNISIYNWKNYEFCYSEFAKNDGEQLAVILELFQCGRPDWMEKILFEDKLNRTVQIIMVDYLTAEKYAEDFHCLDSLTRSKKVQKVNFMPGFTSKTGGLIIDETWEKASEYNPQGAVLVFTYERDWTPLCNSLKKSGKKVMLAQGRGYQSFYDSWNRGAVFGGELAPLDYLNQNDWDLLMKACSVLFIRGEESMSRACLSGIPFVWHAYPQSDEYQLVKVNALLERMSCHFSYEDFELIKSLWLDFNSPEADVDPIMMEKHITDFMNSYKKLQPGFADFAQSLRKNGDLCANLMTFIKKTTIIE